MGQNIISTWARRRWELKRNHIVCVLLDRDKNLGREEALRRANKMMKPLKRRRRRS